MSRLALASGRIQTGFGGGMVCDNLGLNGQVAEMMVLGRAAEPEDIGPMIAGPLSDDDRW